MSAWRTGKRTAALSSGGDCPAAGGRLRAVQPAYSVHPVARGHLETPSSRDVPVQGAVPRPSWPDASIWLFCREAEEGNRYREARGRAPYALPEPELLPFELTTEEYVQLQRAAMEAFSAGHRREVENEETEEDVGLAEFEKKTAPARRRPM